MTSTTARPLDVKQEYERSLAETFGPRPINIFTRLRCMLELSHQELASRMYLSKISLIRLEQGCFDEPLPGALNWWLKYSDAHDAGLSEGSLTHQYEEFQDLMRRRHKKFFGTNLAFDLDSDVHPLAQLRTRCYDGDGASVNEIAKALCLNQSTLQNWEKKWANQKSVPKTFQTALMTIGYSKDLVMAFNSGYDIWRCKHVLRLNRAS